ncbi:hypothetical protein [Microscilla marina]|uniref:Uncharacterized protein n=1 Tax=Microscilla marina ATCC 23134 TaxID=313606 RepID=A1ZK25_MICM2|nr:hypothetical protein [Microscilla marina]EAY29478.1 hypothetical protein M23134_01538 [Microscilla marina ATCC 23134]
MSRFEDNREFIHSRKEFERKLHSLQEQMRQNKFKITVNSSGLITGLEKARLLPSHRIDLFTVNESLRACANMIEQMQYHKDEEKE